MQGECRYAGGVVVQLRYLQAHLIKTCSGCIPRVNVMPDLIPAFPLRFSACIQGKDNLNCVDLLYSCRSRSTTVDLFTNIVSTLETFTKSSLLFCYIRSS